MFVSRRIQATPEALRVPVTSRSRTMRSRTFRQRVLITLLPLASILAAAAPAEAGDVWSRLRQCESGSRYARNTGNGYYGAYQFKPSTWRSLGYRGLPHRASPAVQDRAARRLQARHGWGQWPACSRRLGLRR